MIENSWITNMNGVPHGRDRCQKAPKKPSFLTLFASRLPALET
jgi:hypothetical protein